MEHPSFKGDFVDSDNRTGAFKMTRHIIELGHKKIGIIGGQQSISSGSERLTGFHEAMATIGIPVDDSYPYQFVGNFNRSQSGYDGARTLLSLEDPPTALFAMNNELAIGALRYLRTHNIKVPDQVSFACYGNILNSDLYYVQPDNVDMDPKVIGSKMGEMLIERIEQKNNLPNRELRFTPTLMKGNTLQILSE